MKTRIKMLKVKIKSLAAEARIIRTEERRALSGRKPDGRLYGELRDHRRRDVRKEQRASLLAYAFLRGKPLSACEPKSDTPPDWGRVLSIALKFGPPIPVWPKAAVDAHKAEVESRLKGWATPVVA